MRRTEFTKKSHGSSKRGARVVMHYLVSCFDLSYYEYSGIISANQRPVRSLHPQTRGDVGEVLQIRRIAWKTAWKITWKDALKTVWKTVLKTAWTDALKTVWRIAWKNALKL